MSEYLDSTGLEHLIEKIDTRYMAKDDFELSDWSESDTTSVAYIQNKPTNIVTGTSQSYIIWTGTQALYDAILTKDNSTLYFITEV